MSCSTVSEGAVLADARCAAAAQTLWPSSAPTCHSWEPHHAQPCTAQLPPRSWSVQCELQRRCVARRQGASPMRGASPPRGSSPRFGPWWRPAAGAGDESDASSVGAARAGSAGAAAG